MSSRKYSPYKRGRVFEYRVMKELREHGYYTLRSAGSHTYYDIVAIKPPFTLFIQVKSRRFIEQKIIDESVNAIGNCPYNEYVITYKAGTTRKWYIPRLDALVNSIEALEALLDLEYSG